MRDFIFIEDVVEAYLKAKGIDFKHGEIINIGSGRQHSIKEVVNMVLKITGSKSKVEWGGVVQRYQEPKRWEANISKAKNLLKWQPIHSLEEGLRKDIEWFRLNYSLYE